MTVVRLKDIVTINQRALPDSTAPDFTFRYVDISCVNPDGKVSLPDTTVTFEAAPSRARRLAAPGDVIVSTVRTYLRAIARVPVAADPVVFSTGFAVLSPTPRVDPGYLFYLCRSEPFVQEVVARSVGVSYPAINASELGDFHVDLPELPRQRAIAAELDAETAVLDETRDQLLELAQLIAQRRQATVTDTLERLQPTATMRPLKYLAWATVGIVVTPSAYYVPSGGVPALRSANVRPGRVVDDELIQISLEGHGCTRSPRCGKETSSWSGPAQGPAPLLLSPLGMTEPTASTWSLFGLVARSCRTTCSSSSTRTSHVNTSPGTQSDRGRPTST